MKRRKKRLKRKFKIIFFIFPIIIGFIIFKPENNKYMDKIIKEKYEYEDKIINNTFEEIDKDVEKLIIDYLNVYFRSMKELKVYDLTKFFSSNSYENAYLSQTALEILIDSRIKQLNDLKLDNVSFDIYYEKIENDEETIKVTVKENSHLNFNFMKDITSNIYNVINNFEIIKENNEYKIKSFSKEQGYFIMTEDLYSYENETNEEIKNEFDKIKNDYSLIFDEMLKEQEKLYNQYINNKEIEFKTCDNSYDREKALEYALEYVLKRSDVDYGPYGGNCQNYASWMLNSGGIPMDIKGTYQWKHYDSELNYENTEDGRTPSWTGVSEFYDYAKNNSGFGLCSKVDANMYYAEVGDVVQVGYGNKFRHTAVVVGNIIKDENTVDLLLNSNTGDLEQFPISAYVYPEKRLIKILGWNN